MSDLENKRHGEGYCPPGITVERIDIECGFASSLDLSGDDKEIDDLENWEGWD